MVENCEVCGNELNHEKLTHCSEDCLFSSIQGTKSISRTPLENWDENNYWF